METFDYVVIGIIVFTFIFLIIKSLPNKKTEVKRFLIYLKKEMSGCSGAHICNPEFSIDGQTLNVNFSIYHEGFIHHTWFFCFDFKSKTFSQHQIDRKKEKRHVYAGFLSEGIERIESIIGIKK